MDFRGPGPSPQVSEPEDRIDVVTQNASTSAVEPPDPERKSVTFTSQGALKVERAARLFERLEREIDAWNAEHQVYAPTRVPWDGEARIQMFRPTEVDAIPWVDWEATFHEGVHNLRAGLDTLCFELAHIDSLPAKPKKIYFPITRDEGEWQERTRYLESVPVGLLERLRECQPWARPDPLSPDPLGLISEIDNADKHRGQGVKFEVLPWPQWQVRPTLPLPQDLSEALDWPLEEWLTMTVPPPPERGTASMTPVYVLPMVLYQDLLAVLPDAQRWLHTEVVRMIRFIMSGIWPEVTAPRVFPEPTWNRWAPPWLSGVAPGSGEAGHEG